MKNIKMQDETIKKKLVKTFSMMLVLMSLTILLAMTDMSVLKKQTETLMQKTLRNTIYIQEMKENLISEQRYNLLAFASKEQSSIEDYLNKARQEIEENTVLMEEYRKNYRIDESKVNRLTDGFAMMSESRIQLADLLRQGTTKANEEAHSLFEKEYKLQMDKQIDLLNEIKNDQNHLAERSAKRAFIIFWLSVIVLCISVAAAMFISISMFRKLVSQIMIPLEQIKAASMALAKGDFSAEITYESRNEMGITCSCVRESFSILKELIVQLTEIFYELGKGNLPAHSSIEFPGELRGIETAGEELVTKLSAAFGNIKDMADRIQIGSEQFAHASQELAEGATQQAGSMQEVTANFQQISGQIKDISKEAAKETALLIESSIDTVGKGNEIAQNTSMALGRIARYIEEVTGVVKGISEMVQSEVEAVADISKELEVFADIAQTKSAAREEIAASGEELKAQANALHGVVDGFKVS